MALTGDVLMVNVHGAVVLAVSPSTTCQHSTPVAGGRNVRQLVVHFTRARVRALRPELDSYTHRNVVSVRIQLRHAATDGRVGDRYRKSM